VTEVTAIGEQDITVKVKNDGSFSERSTLHLPGSELVLPVLNKADIEDLDDLVGSINALALSSIRKAEDIEVVKSELGEKFSNLFTFVKIENHQALHNYEEILASCDGVMINRCALGLEIPPEKVFIAQKWMVEKANILGKPVICQSQMAESMVRAPRPSRAEATNILNAVQDGSDALALGCETATGDYPINAVMFVSKIAREAEHGFDHKQNYKEMRNILPSPLSTPESIAVNAI
jgi:pyruvate kinase